MHGGLFAQDNVTLDDLRKVERNRQPPDSGWHQLLSLWEWYLLVDIFSLPVSDENMYAYFEGGFLVHLNTVKLLSHFVHTTKLLFQPYSFLPAPKSIRGLKKYAEGIVVTKANSIARSLNLNRKSGGKTVFRFQDWCANCCGLILNHSSVVQRANVALAFSLVPTWLTSFFGWTIWIS